GVEPCDDGNALDTDACLSTCEAASCGDGFVRVGAEQCDDGNLVDGDGCESDCSVTVAQKLVFVSSQLYKGNLGGLAGADLKCQQLAQAAGLPGTYMAWLSTIQASPATRMTHAAVPYVLPNGVKIADNWADLVDGNIDHPIDITETGGPVPFGGPHCGLNARASVWTATRKNGTLYDEFWSCSDWTKDSGSGLWGNAKEEDDDWTESCTGDSCARPSSIYCFQQ
ncbi:DUF4215 domain-containing protein, partial [Nannocystis exedens]